MGVDINASKGSMLLTNIWKCLFLLSCVIYVQYCLINSVIYNGITNLDLTAVSLSLFNQGCLILFKFTTFLVTGDTFMKLVWDINNLAKKANSNEKEKWLSENMRAQLIGKLYFYTCWIVVGLSATFPLIYMIYDYTNNNEFKQKLPFGGKFPYMETSAYIFIISYILSLLFVYCLVNMSVAVDAFYVWYVHSISAHFRILRCKVEKAALKLVNNDSMQFTQDIAQIVCYHIRTLKFVEDMNDIFCGILWAEVMLSSLQVCFAIYTVNNDDNVFNLPLNLMILIVSVMQVSMYCICGEKIKNESLLLSMDFYLKFPWHKMSPQQKKLMLLPLIRSQRLSGLRGLFFEIDHNLLVYILKTSFSINALISAMEE